MLRRLLTATFALALVACSVRRETAPPAPAPRPTGATPAAHPVDTLRPGTYEPFEPPPSPVARDSVARAEPARPPTGRAGDGSDVGAGARPDLPYVIQIAAFAEREPADDLAELLRRRYGDYPVRVVSGAGVHRVWLGGWASRDDAASVLVIVRQRHPDAWIVAR